MVRSSVKVWSRLETDASRGGGFGPGGGAEDAEDEDGGAVTDVEGPAEVRGGGDTGVGGAAAPRPTRNTSLRPIRSAVDAENIRKVASTSV